MSITIYQQSKAFVYLSRFHLTRFLIASGGCIAAYTLGKRLCHKTNSERLRAYGSISVHYSKFCGTILWGHMLALTGGALVYARIKNLPRAVMLQRGFVYGEQLGFSCACMYLITKELSGREWFAQISAAAFSGLKYSLIQGFKGWAAYHSTRIGAYVGIVIFLTYSLCECLRDLWAVFIDPELKYSAWDEFDLVDFFKRKIYRFFKVDGWVRYLESKDVEEAIISLRQEMDELEELAWQAGISKSDLQFVNVDEISEHIFNILDAIKTGRPEYDDIKQTSATIFEMRLRQFDPHYVSQSGRHDESWEVYQRGGIYGANPRDSGGSMIVEKGGSSPQLKSSNVADDSEKIDWRYIKGRN